VPALERVTAGLTPITAKARPTTVASAKALALQNQLIATTAANLLAFAVANTQKTCLLLIVQIAIKSG
jgi:hypothetical protein